MAVTWWTPSSRMVPPGWVDATLDAGRTRKMRQEAVRSRTGGNGGPPPRQAQRGPVTGVWLPDARAQVGRPHHAVAILAAPRVVELLEVRQRAVHAPVRR